MSQKEVYSKWIKKGTNTFLPTDNSEILGQVDAGVYDIRYADGIGFYLFKKEVHLDELLEFPSSIHSQVLDTVRDFWTRRDKFKEYGFAFKRGVLLFGKPGSGKTGIISLCTKYIIEQMDGIVLSLNNPNELSMYASFMPEIFRVIEPDRPVICVFEDIESMCRSSETESQLLNVLDGLEQMENVVYLGSTNYIEDLKERIINRPSRFDRRIYVPFLSKEDRIYYFQHKLKPADLKKTNIEQWAEDTEGMSIAHLAELIKSVVIFGADYNETIQILKEMQDFKTLHSSKYEKDSGSIGFTRAIINHPQELAQPAPQFYKNGR